MQQLRKKCRKKIKTHAHKSCKDFINWYLTFNPNLFGTMAETSLCWLYASGIHFDGYLGFYSCGDLSWCHSLFVSCQHERLRKTGTPSSLKHSCCPEGKFRKKNLKSFWSKTCGAKKTKQSKNRKLTKQARPTPMRVCSHMIPLSFLCTGTKGRQIPFALMSHTPFFCS